MLSTTIPTSVERCCGGTPFCPKTGAPSRAPMKPKAEPANVTSVRRRRRDSILYILTYCPGTMLALRPTSWHYLNCLDSLVTLKPYYPV